MEITFNFKKKIVMNGKEYSSVEEMPAEIRLVYEKAMARIQGTDSDSKGLIITNKTTVDGATYENESAMPSDIRDLYKALKASAQIKNAESSGGARVDEGNNPSGRVDFLSMDRRPITPRSSLSLRAIMITVGVLIVIGLLYFLLYAR